ncbi:MULTISPECIES: DUF2489 domain-containing protein [Aliagarivorans]|uniref:DUF2489 domain-containing protein n=1 Tax=Aliagarivorans TaxID=882379 RepID=UPI0003FD8935|nr:MULTISPECIES: DUF2489 domain-containing protein [Aliagarivorans]
MPTVILLIAALIILGLAAYAAVLVGRLIAQRRMIQQAVAKRNQRLTDDIRYIAKAILDERCGLSEGVIRLCNLLPVMQSQQVIDWRGHYPSLFALYDKVKDLPTHEARNALPLKQRRQQDFKRWQDEQDMEQGILDEAKRLLDFELSHYLEK